MREKLKLRDEDSKAYLNRFERLLMQLTRHELNGHAEFMNDSSFRLKAHPPGAQAAAIPLGLYELPRRTGEAHLYRLNHPLADAVLAQAKGRELPLAGIRFAYADHEGRITVLEPLIGKSGWLSLSLFTVEALDLAEDHLIFAAVTEDGQMLDDEVASRLMTLPAANFPLPVGDVASGSPLPPGDGPGVRENLLESITTQRQIAIKRTISERNARFFEAEADKLDGWADDLKLGLEREIKELDRQIKEVRRAATTAMTLEDKLVGQKQIKALEAQRNQKRRTLFDAQDQVDKQREELIATIEGKLTQATRVERLLSLHWTVA